MHQICKKHFFIFLPHSLTSLLCCKQHLHPRFITFLEDVQPPSPLNLNHGHISLRHFWMATHFHFSSPTVPRKHDLVVIVCNSVQTDEKYWDFRQYNPLLTSKIRKPVHSRYYKPGESIDIINLQNRRITSWEQNYYYALKKASKRTAFKAEFEPFGGFFHFSKLFCEC